MRTLKHLTFGFSIHFVQRYRLLVKGQNRNYIYFY